MNAENKVRHNIIVLCCCIVCVIAAAVCLAVSFSANKKKTQEAVGNKVVAQVGDLKVTENQFKFFAGLILNQEEETVRTLYTSSNLSDKDEIKQYTSNFAHEYLVRVAEAKEQGVTLTEDELSDLEKQFKTDYENNKNVDGEVLDEEDFYLYYYGITSSEYKEFWKNWYIIDKHTNILENSADVSENAQQLAFEEYYDYLYSYTISVIELKVNTENTKADLLTKAEAIKTQLESGADFVSLLKENCTDETLLKNNGVKEFYPIHKTEASEIYDFVRTSAIGEIGIVSTEYEVYILRLDAIKDFEKLKNTETLLKWTRTFHVNKTVADLVSSDKYDYELQKDVYDSIDLSGVLQEAYTYWESVWEENK
ncbi:MAG: hypothetical protein E7387_01910 [Ruminococcaceae bacterium]|nr:hypothetical protein [Oscillospiraceae bacterium]